MSSPVDDLRATMAKGWLSALERVMPPDGHFDSGVLAAAGDLPIVESPAHEDGMTPSEVAERKLMDRLGARAFFKAFASRVLATRLASNRIRRYDLEKSGISGPAMDLARAEESYWQSVSEWLEDFEP